MHALGSQYRLELRMGANRQLPELRVSPPITAHLIFLEFSFLDLSFSSINALSRFLNYETLYASETRAFKKSGLTELGGPGGKWPSQNFSDIKGGVFTKIKVS